MSKGIYTAVSGAMAQTQKLETIANNLANVNTPGFKRDSQIFKEYLSAYEKEPGVVEVPRIPASIESFYDMQGGDKSYVDVAGTYTDFQQGFLKQTGNPLDIGIEGKGFFEVLTPEGVKLTRAGNFTLDGEGRVVTKQGYPVLKDSGGGAGLDPASREIKTNGAKVSISATGEIFEAGQNLGKLSILNVGNRDALLKTGAGLFGFKDNLNANMTVATDSVIHQGSLEGSNVNTVKEMTDMITATRTFESTQKAIQAYDEMHKRLVNDVPKLSQG
jgi:flagellar basal-body rod protein FlgF